MKSAILRIVVILFCFLMFPAAAILAEENAVVDIQILATSDLHGMFYPWDYMRDSEHPSGSLAQIATAVKERRNVNTLVLDAGDAIQDNLADLFVKDNPNAMIAAMNLIGYDAVTTGNHEYNYGMDVLRSILSQHKADVLVGNVWDENGQSVGKPYAVYEKSGIRIGIIGMVTPNILRWDEKNLKGCTVTDPAAESRKVIDELKGKVDILIGIMHMGVNNEYGVANSGVADLTAACPEFDVIIAAHDHQAIEDKIINGVLVVENQNQAKTLCEIHIYMEKTETGWKVKDKTSETVKMKGVEADAEILAAMQPTHEKMRAYVQNVIGRLEGGNLTPVDEINGIPQAQLEDTALIDLIHKAQLYYSGAKVSSTSLTSMNAGLSEGDIRLCDVSRIYKYSNTLYLLSMNGAQLKAYMEWSANYYQQYQPGDLTVAFNPKIRSYNYDMFEGVNYEIDISKPVGERIQNLTWLDGTPVKADEEFTLCTSNYRATGSLLIPGEIYTDDNLPKLIEIDVHGNDIGGIREMVARYIQDVCGGVIQPGCSHNWKMIGNNWDNELHQKAVEQINSGLLTLQTSDDGRTPNIKVVTEQDLK